MTTGQDAPHTRWLGFPPGKHYVVLPAQPRRAALTGLALYDATLPHQRLALAGGRTLIRLGLGRALAVRHEPPLPSARWWQTWIGDVVTKTLPSTTHVAFRPGPNDGLTGKVTALFIDAEGRPVGFGKFPKAGRPTAATIAFHQRLADHPPATFSVPAILDLGEFEGRRYLIQQPLPEGVHRRLPFEPRFIRTVIAEYQEILGDLDAPGDTPRGHVPIHGDLLPLNVRRSAGKTWVFDWDRACWGHPLGDALVYFIGDLARRRGPMGPKAALVVEELGGPTAHAEIRAAVSWRIEDREAEGTAEEQALRTAVLDIVS